MFDLICLLYPFLLALLFLLIHLKGRKVSILFHLMFYLTMGLLACGTRIVSFQVDLVILLIATLVFLLSEQSSRYIKKNYEEQFGEYQDRILSIQVSEVHNIYLTMRGWRHDYHNHMQLLKAHLAMGQYEQVKNYLNQLEEDLDSIDVAYKTGNVSLDAILNSKLTVAEKQDIEIHCKATVPEKLAVADVDLCVVIGNLLDNAMESCEKMKIKEQRFLRVYIGVFKQQLYISVTNSTSEVIRKLDKEYISSKRGNHGHGLKRIDAIVEKYDGFINRKNEPGVFVTEIMLPL
ncbi:MAG TPA: GHKL domain-containing protein [Lachnospiraceae bacterium]|nr:GHKL domain-containing protein [Lachnospiraceae bacterium]